MEDKAIQQVEEASPSIVNDYDIDAFLEKRKEFIEKVNAIMVKGSDYHEIQGKKNLAKGGAEKIASIFGWTARFERDADAMAAFNTITGIISFICNLQKNGDFVGQGRGAATLGKNAGDPNKTLKMAQKSAFIDAVLRASGLSDFFTQDLEDMSEQEIKKPNFITTDTTMAEVKTKDTPICPDHNKALRYGKFGYYCPTKVNGGWCKYRPLEQNELPTIQQNTDDIAELAKDYM